jgi:hypothetical protein
MGEGVTTSQGPQGSQAMSCNVMLGYFMLCYVVLRYVMLCYVILCYGEHINQYLPVGVMAARREAMRAAGACVNPPNMTCGMRVACRYVTVSIPGSMLYRAKIEFGITPLTQEP